MKKHTAESIAQLLELPIDMITKCLEIIRAETIEEARKHHQEARKGSAEEKLSARNWDRLTLIALGEAEMVGEFAKVVAEARQDSEAYYMALEGLFEHVTATIVIMR